MWKPWSIERCGHGYWLRHQSVFVSFSKHHDRDDLSYPSFTLMNLIPICLADCG